MTDLALVESLRIMARKLNEADVPRQGRFVMMTLTTWCSLVQGGSKRLRRKVGRLIRKGKVQKAEVQQNAVVFSAGALRRPRRA